MVRSRRWRTSCATSGRSGSGISSPAPDVYEQPVHQLDFTVKQKLTSRLQLAFKARNLIDPVIRFTQAGMVTESYRRGRAFSVGLAGSL
jgi:hypothetical protein